MGFPESVCITLDCFERKVKRLIVVWTRASFWRIGMMHFVGSQSSFFSSIFISLSSSFTSFMPSFTASSAILSPLLISSVSKSSSTSCFAPSTPRSNPFPSFNNHSTTSCFPLLSASYTASCPAVLRFAGSAPAPMRILTASRWPLRAAQWRGVLPELLVRLMLSGGGEGEEGGRTCRRMSRYVMMY